MNVGGTGSLPARVCAPAIQGWQAAAGTRQRVEFGAKPRNMSMLVDKSGRDSVNH